jgi:hypothetical protein
VANTILHHKVLIAELLDWELKYIFAIPEGPSKKLHTTDKTNDQTIKASYITSQVTS